MRKILFGSFIVGVTISVLSLLSTINKPHTQSAEAVTPVVIDLASDAAHSTVDEKTTSTQFFVTANTGYLFKSTQADEAAAADFITRDPDVIDTNVQGVSTTGLKKIQKKLLPKSLIKNLMLKRKKVDSDGTTHFYFSQKVGNKPVFGSSLSLHIRNRNEIYAAIGSLTLQDSVAAAAISVTLAEEKALMEAKQSASASGSLQVVKSEDGIFNAGIIEGTDKTQNLPVQIVIVADSTDKPSYAEKFIISLVDGSVLLRLPMVYDALDRKIFDCDGGLSTCPLVRTEGSAASGRPQADSIYTFLGDTYSFYQNTFQRDSYDNAGAQIVSFVNVEDATVGCPNAAWIAAPYSRLLICPNMVANDIVAHELTHAVVEHTAALIMYKQTGALHEAIADIFSFGVDNDWTIAEDAVTGVLRNAQNPLADPSRSGGPHPDRLFSQYYRCTTSDDGGVHANMTVITKTFYLMSEGGAFNGCTITGIGKTTAQKIWYRALTTYLSSSSNFGYAYLGVQQACGDLYGSSSDICNQTAKAFQATEVDQQPTTSQDGAICISVTPRQATCAGAPTATPTPTSSVTIILTPTLTKVPSPTLTSAITPSPTTGCLSKSAGDADCNGVVDLVDFEIWRKEFTQTLTTKNGDFNANGVVDIVDFEIWRKGRFGL